MSQVIENPVCENCRQSFPITDDDAQFYDELKVPKPRFCQHCRQQRRLSWRNERTLYIRKCDATGEMTLSVFSQDKPCQVYKNEYWYGNEWSAYDYGVDYDFNRSFFAQFQDLMYRVPQLARSTLNNLNCDYVNECGWSKNCYLIFEADGNENCLYNNNMFDCRWCMENYHIYDCELCYQCVDCRKCYNAKYSQNCMTCSESWFLKNCIGCMNCFGCVNLRNKQFYIYNKRYSREEYFATLERFGLNDPVRIAELHEQFRAYASGFPHKAIYGTQNEDSDGDYLFNTQRCHACYDVNHAQDCKFVYNARNVKKVYDMMVFGADDGAEYCCDNHEIGAGVRNIFFSEQIWGGANNIYYSKLCIQNSHDLFGCVGMKKAEYCILNKQYSKEEYEAMLPRIIEHMKSTGEWGDFPPTWLSFFGYNETLAMEYFPLTKEQAVAKGWKWKEAEVKQYKPQTYTGSRKTNEVPDTITKEVMACTGCDKNFKIVVQEIDFLRKQNLPIPDMCYECRHRDRVTRRNPRYLWTRNCGKCGISLQTSYAPERSEPIYCEPCYLTLVE